MRDEFERSYLDMEIRDDDVRMEVDLPAKPAVDASNLVRVYSFEFPLHSLTVL